MAQYPTSAATDANLYVAVNNLRTQLDGSLGAGVMTVTVDDTTGFPSSGLVSVDVEVIAYAGKTGTSFTGCTRGFDGTSDVLHADNAFVSLRVVAAHHNATKDEVKAIETDLVAVKAALDQADTPASTAADVKDRFDQVATELKRIHGQTNWYDAVGIPLNAVTGTAIGVGRNRLVNGEMVIDQRYAGTLVSVTATPTRPVVIDMFKWQGRNADGVYSVQRINSSPPTGFKYYAHVVVTTADASIAAGDTYYMWNRIETPMVRDFLFGTAGAKTVTLSFWVRSSLTGTFAGCLQNTAQDRSYVFTYAISSANTWEYKTVTVPGDTSGTWVNDPLDFGIGMSLFFELGVGSTFQGTANTWNAANVQGTSTSVKLMSTLSATWDITGLQLEVGSVATPFEYRPMQVELALCQRYFEKTFNLETAVGNTGSSVGNLNYRVAAAGVTNQGIFWNFKVPKRAAPTITAYNPINANSNWYNSIDAADSGAALGQDIGESSAYIRSTQIATDGVGDALRVHATAEAAL